MIEAPACGQRPSRGGAYLRYMGDMSAVIAPPPEITTTRVEQSYTYLLGIANPSHPITAQDTPNLTAAQTTA